MRSLSRSFYLVFLAQLASIVFSIAAAQILYAVLFVIWMAVVYRKRDFVFNAFDAVVTAFFLVRIVSIVASDFPASSAPAYFREAVFYPYYYIAAYFIRTHDVQGMKTAIRVLLYAAIVPSLYAVVTVAARMADRGASFSGGYYGFAIHLAFVIAFAAALIIAEGGAKRKRIGLSLLAVVSVALLSTYTRSMWIAGGCCLLLFGFIAYRRWMIPALVALALLIAVIPSLRERSATLQNPAEHSSGRLEIWKAAVEKIPAHPFLGYGPETFTAVFGDRSQLPDPYVSSWHNEFLQVQIESGVFALCLLLAVYGIPVWMMIALRKRNPDSDGLFLRNFIMFSFIVIVPSVLFGTVIMSILNGMVLKFVLAGYSFIGGRKKLWREHLPGRAA